ncbi:MAG: ATP-grasp domain-containing protein [Bacillota bacterium]|uniref:ATP-grasp domain-containing protein n=1 Tax=Rossellomorea sp. FM04394 TaxID=3243076 RepID=UPI0035A697C3
MNTIVFIGSHKSGTSREALKVSKEMGYVTVLITDRSNLISQKDEFPEVDEMLYMENLLNKGELLNILHSLQQLGHHLSACLSFIDPFVSYASRISTELGLFPASVEALSIMENKANVRKHLHHLPSSLSYSMLAMNESMSDFNLGQRDVWPLIIKPSKSNGSKNIMLAKTLRELSEGINLLRRKHPDMNLMIEEFVNGPQYLMEVLVYKQEVNIIAVVEQEVGSNFIITGYAYPAKLDPQEFQSLHNSILEIVECIGLENGSCHLEMRKAKGGWKLIEMNPRMSGAAMNRLIKEGTGINLVREIIKVNLGLPPKTSPAFTKPVYAKYVTVNSAGRLLKVTGRNRASSHDGVKYVYVKPKKGSVLVPPKSMGNRYACVIAAADSIKAAKEIAIKAAKELRFFLEPL